VRSQITLARRTVKEVARNHRYPVAV
jgi:hypothetical protein